MSWPTAIVQWLRPQSVSYGYAAIAPSDPSNANWDTGAGMIPRASGTGNGADGYKPTFSPI